LVHFKEFAPFYVGQNFISHVKLMQKFKNNNKRKKRLVEIMFFFFSNFLCCYFGYHSWGDLAMFGYSPTMKSNFKNIMVTCLNKM